MTTAEYRDALHGRLDELVELTGALVGIDSPPDHPEGVSRTAALLGETLRAAGMEVDIDPVDGCGDRLTARRRFGSGARVLVLGHSDTTWPVGTAAEWPFARDGDLITGPGVGDMKANLVMAAAAIEEFGQGPAAAGLGEVTLLVVPDEELGSPRSRGWIEDAARTADVCLGLEPGRPGGGVVVSRGAVGALTITARGVSAHTTAEHGRSAVALLAPLVERLESLSDRAAGVIVTVGVFAGGGARQVVPDRARMLVDLRAPSAERAERLLHDVRAVVSGAGAGVQLEGGFTRPAFARTEQSDRLYAALSDLAGEIGEAAVGVHERGGSDVSFAGALGVPSLDGLGPVTHDPCSRRERVEVASIASRGALLAGLLDRLARRGPPRLWEAA